MAAINIEDSTGRMEATIFPKQWTKIKENINEDAIYTIRSVTRVTKGDEEESPPVVSLIVNEMIEIKNDQKGTPIQPLSVKLEDETVVEFLPLPDTKYSSFQQALAIVNNVERMK